MSSSKIIIEDYSPLWPVAFEQLKAGLLAQLGELAADIQHVGSTAVAGLAAKPVIDLDIIIESRAQLPAVIEKLAAMGYDYCGDQGIKDREAFKQPGGSAIKHHLYVCPQHSASLKNHLALRDLLRADPALVIAYGNLKKELAVKYAHNIDLYVENKTAFIISALKMCGFNNDALQEITEQNKA